MPKAAAGDARSATVVLSCIHTRARLYALYQDSTAIDVGVKIDDIQLVKERLESAGLL